MTKKCSRCKEQKDFADYGRDCYCRACRKIINQEHYKKLKDTPHRKEQIKRSFARYNENHPERRKARRRLEAALRSGKVIKLPCRVCGHIKTEAHHNDYSKALDVVWVCKDHHEQLHHSR